MVMYLIGLNHFCYTVSVICHIILSQAFCAQFCWRDLLEPFIYKAL